METNNPHKTQTMDAIKRLNDTIEKRDNMITKILYSGKLNLQTDTQYDKKENELNKKSYQQLINFCEKLQITL